MTDEQIEDIMDYLHEYEENPEKVAVISYNGVINIQEALSELLKWREDADKMIRKQKEDNWSIAAACLGLGKSIEEVNAHGSADYVIHDYVIHMAECIAAANELRTFEEGAYFLHFKGGIYQIVAYAEHTENGEKLYIYKCLKPCKGKESSEGKTYARPAEMFVSEVDKEKYPDVPLKWRMTRLPEAVAKEMLEAYNDMMEQQYTNNIKF